MSFSIPYRSFGVLLWELLTGEMPYRVNWCIFILNNSNCWYQYYHDILFWAAKKYNSKSVT